jgi:hemolysin III
MLNTALPAGPLEPTAGGLPPADLPSGSGMVHRSGKSQQSWPVATAETANSITHGLGLLLSIIAAVILLPTAAARDFWQWAAVWIYSITMVAVYAASTASHVFAQPRVRHMFRMLDQGCIYLFIAGTFTPIAATYLRGGLWWLLLSAIWLVALGGFVSKVALNHRINNVSSIIPLLLGWMPLLGGPALLTLVPWEVRCWMLAGGVCYTVGILFLMYDHRHRYLHAVWHVWVIAGTACHFWAIQHYALAVV